MNIVYTDGVPNPATIVNVVSTYNLGGLTLNLRKIAIYERDKIPVKFNPMRFAAATVNLTNEDDKTTALMFGSGNMVHTGAKTEEEARLHAHTLVRFLNTFLDIPARVTDFTITNIVCDFKLGFEVDLSAIKKELGTRAKYNPIKFPACRILSIDDPKEVGLVYTSGGTVLTGLKNRQRTNKLHKSIYDICCRHRFVAKGSVSKAEMRMIDIKNASSNKNLAALNKKWGKMRDTYSKGLSTAIKQTSKRALTIKGAREAEGTLYIGSIDPFASTSIVPFKLTSGMSQ